MALLDEALHLEGNKLLQPGKILLVKDCVATSGAFILTHLIKKTLYGSSDPVVSSKASGQSVLQSGLVLFVGLSEPFTHYERIARKLGFNLSAYRDNGQFIFIDGLHLECKGSNGAMTESALIELYKSIHQTLHGCFSLVRNMGCNCIMIDDVSLLEIAAHGSEDCVLDFLHYCRILSLDMGCSLVLLSHQDIYASLSDPRFIKHLEYFADIMIDVEPLNSGIATDVHGQFEVVRDQQNYCLRKGFIQRSSLCRFVYKYQEFVHIFYAYSLQTCGSSLEVNRGQIASLILLYYSDATAPTL